MIPGGIWIWEMPFNSWRASIVIGVVTDFVTVAMPTTEPVSATSAALCGPCLQSHYDPSAP